MALSVRQQRLRDEYLIDPHAERAALKAGYSPSWARKLSWAMIGKGELGRQIAAAMAKRAEKAQLVQADVFRMWSQAATTDRNELVEVRRVCCRWCWGENGRYQETPAEREQRWGRHQLLLMQTKEKDWAKLPPFDELGGVGYDPRKPINPECGECFGDGTERTIIKDTRTLSPDARAIYEGAEVTKDGVKIKTVSREKATEMLARHMGMLVDRSVVLTGQVQPKTLAEFYGQLPSPNSDPGDTDA